ncbi:hypothetical protein COT93_03075 [Candidatus Falkowbacteria bacterium CG10_big_fil_rev_8_21_14_0_10_37_18]|uniref:Metallo-beta-lactamase domain-containing protein n=1 Tax=Candidatus Falkowbacteria bacterium CG10_big_fil_rev_8_21_14_0_10_37_18 TaxID=1974562 RepID=A0A2H0V8A1_9BACT|nr:MAG: hypothetical protein COT93_03075 [Candidatus Falkowbacteria bacterium CG10_big_fil_rev_8_21_14_0_10_37_18]
MFLSFFQARFVMVITMTKFNLIKQFRTRKIRLILFILLVIFSILLVWSLSLYSERGRGRLLVNFLDIGQGDAVLIRLPSGQTILIDGGPDNIILRRLGEYLPFYQRRLDYVFYSHYHADHIGGLVEIIKRYEVNNLVYAPGDYSSALLDTLEQSAAASQANDMPIISTAQINFSDDCFLNLLNPRLLQVPADQNNSLVIYLNCAGKKFLFSGDNNHRVEQALLALSADQENCDRFACDLWVDVFKASHHGSKTANSKEFLLALQVQLLVISVGVDNRFGHPYPATLERAKSLGIIVKRTDLDGTISFDGS